MSRIREATPEDAERVAEIYRPYVENTAVTFETVPPDEAEMRSRIVEHLKAYPFLVMEEDGRVVGYAYAGAFHERRAYRPTVELSVYMDEAFRGAGRGEALVRELLSRLKADPRYFTAMAVIVHPNPRSERMFEKLGFGVNPSPFEPREDIIQVISLGNREKLIASFAAEARGRNAGHELKTEEMKHV